MYECGVSGMALRDEISIYAMNKSENVYEQHKIHTPLTHPNKLI